MRYLLMICSEESLETNMSPDEMGALMGGYESLDAELRKALSLPLGVPYASEMATEAVARARWKEKT